MTEWFKPLVKRASEEVDEWCKRALIRKLCTPKYIDAFIDEFHEALQQATSNIITRFGTDEVTARLNSDDKILQIELIKETVAIMAKN